MKCFNCDADRANGRTICKDCFNATRRATSKPSICNYCKNEHRPGKDSYKRYCSEKCRFMDKVSIGYNCWLWNGYIQDGCGFFVNKGSKSNRLAHRVSYEIHKESLLDNQFIVQSCGRKNCVNPDHLFIKGTEESKECQDCLTDKPVSEFKKLRKSCKECVQKDRRERYRLSTCIYCEEDYHPYKKGCGRFCSIQCRFMDKVKVIPGIDCWLWKASRNKTGYGSFVPGKDAKSGLAHRESYKIFKGDFDEGLCVLHICDTPPCVNPKHLKLGTPLDNAQDFKERGVSNWRDKLKEN